MAYQSTNPYTAQTVQTFSQISDEMLEQHLNAAGNCFQTNWRLTTFDQRKTVLKRAAQLMRERSGELAALVTLEMGKLIAQSQGEVALSAAILDSTRTTPKPS